MEGIHSVKYSVVYSSDLRGVETMTPKQLELFNRLTPLQKGVVQGVETGMSPRAAYYAAGGKAANDRVADSSACRLLTDSNVLAFRESLAGEKVNALVMSREEMRVRLTAIARSCVSDLVRVENVIIGFTDEGEPITVPRAEMTDFRDAPADALVALAEVNPTKYGIGLKMQSATAAMKLLAELDGLEAPKKTELTGFGGTTVTVTATTPAEAAAQYQALMQ